MYYSYLKLTYNEGKLIWSKTVPFKQDRTDCSFYSYYWTYDMQVNPLATNNFLSSLQYVCGPGTMNLGVYTYLNDNGVDLIVPY